MNKNLTPKQARNRMIAAWARQEGLPTNGEGWLATKQAFAIHEAAGLTDPEPSAQPTATKVAFDPRSTAVGPKGGDPAKRLRTILATEISGQEWGPEHRAAWKSLAGWTLADLAAEMGIKA